MFEFERSVASDYIDAGIDRVVRVVDGDSFIAHRIQRIGVTDDLIIYGEDRFQRNMRLLWLNTPEKPARGSVGYEEGRLAWARAKADLAEWIGRREGFLAVRCHGEDNFGRLLVDLYYDLDPDDTASKYMLIDKEWPPFTGLRQEGESS